MTSQTKSLFDHLVRLGLEQLEVSDLSKMFGVTRQRVSQMKSYRRDRHVPPHHVKILEEANRAADVVAEFQVEAYLASVRPSEEEMEEMYGNDFDKAAEAVSQSGIDPEIGRIIMTGGIDEVFRTLRTQAWKATLSQEDWYLRMYESTLGPPPFPPLGEHHGRGFFNLYNIAMRRAADRIKTLGGSPYVGLAYPSAERSCKEHDHFLWARTWDISNEDLAAMIDVPMDTGLEWKWEFEPG
jgi:hypothetical protein